jgi:hypothetical protein
MTKKVISMEVPAGIQRDGTVFDAPCYVDGKWVRFQRGRPRKIGGYNGIFLDATGVSRGMAMTAVNGLNYVVSGYNNGLQQWITDSDDGLGSGPYNYSFSGGVVATSITNGGSLYTVGTYTGVPLTGGSGAGALATVVVSTVTINGVPTNQVTSVVITTAGSAYVVGDVLSASAASIGGTGSGFTLSVTGNTTFLSDDNNLWQFDVAYDSTGNNTNNLVAHPGQNLKYITSTTNTPVLYGEFPGNSSALTLSKVGVFTASANTTNGSPTLTLLANTVRIGAGQTISGAGIPSGTTVSSVLGTTVTMSQNATATTTNPLSSVYMTGTSGQFASAATTGLAAGQLVNISGSTSQTSLGSLYATSTSGLFSYTSGANLSVGQAVTVNGTTANTSLASVYATSTAGAFNCAAAGTILSVGQQVTFSGTSTNTTVSNVYATGTAGNFSCTNPGITLQVGQVVTISGTTTATALSNVYSIGSNGTFVCSTSGTLLQVGQTLTVSGTSSTTALTGVVITGTGGTFSCTASGTTLYVGQPVVISGTFGGTGSISGYSNPTTYYIIATNGSTTFTLSATLGGGAVTTVAGTPTGVTYTLSAATLSGYSNPTTYYIIATDGVSTFQLSTTSGGSAITTTVGATTSLGFTANATAITGYANPTAYYIIATNGSTTFQLSTTSGGSAIATTLGPTTGLTFTANSLSIAGYATPTTYYIIATNGSTTFTLSTTANGSAVTTGVGPATGLTVSSLATAITGYANPTIYYVIATNGTSTAQLSATLGGGSITTTIGPATGLSFLLNAPSVLSGVVITGTAGQFSCTAAPVTLVTGQPVVISGTLGGTGSITGYVNPTTYYIIATNGSTTFTLSASLGGSAITTTAGTPTGLTYTLSAASIPGYTGSNSYYIIATNGTSTFQLSATSGGAALTTVIGTTTNLTFTVSNPITATFDNNISVSGGCVVIHPYLFVYGNNGLIQNSSAGDFANWVAADANANNVATGKIVKGLPIRGGSTSPSGLFWAADALIRVSFQPSSVGGINYYWTYDLVSSQTSIMSSSSVIEYDGIFYWAGVDRFLMYNGVVQEVPNGNNQNYFFDNVNMAQRQKVWATKVPRYGEIWFFYPKGAATECTDAIIYNVRDKTWYDAGEADGARRSAGVFSEVFPKPIWAGIDANSSGKYTLWQHETGVDRTYLTSVNAVQSYFETYSVGTLGGLVGSVQQPGDNLWTRLERIEPDFVQVGDMTVVVTGQGYADDTVVDSDPYVFGPNTLKIDMREQRREMRLRFESNTAGGTYQTGRVLLSLTTGDVRGTGNP